MAKRISYSIPTGKAKAFSLPVLFPNGIITSSVHSNDQQVTFAHRWGSDEDGALSTRVDGSGYLTTPLPYDDDLQTVLANASRSCNTRLSGGPSQVELVIYNNSGSTATGVFIAEVVAAS